MLTHNFHGFPLPLDRPAQQVQSLSIQLHIKRKSLTMMTKRFNASPQLHTFCYFTKLVLYVVNFILALFYWEVFEDLLKMNVANSTKSDFITLLFHNSCVCLHLMLILVNIIVNHMLSFHLLLWKTLFHNLDDEKVGYLSIFKLWQLF